MGFWGGSEIVAPSGRRIAKAKYYDEDFVVGEVNLELVRRKRTMAPLLRDEDLDLTINELMRIRERPSETKKEQRSSGAVEHWSKKRRVRRKKGRRRQRK